MQHVLDIKGAMVVGETIFISEQFEGVITYVHHSGLKIVKCYGKNNVCSISMVYL